MEARYYRDLILRAIFGPDADKEEPPAIADSPTLDAIAGQLAKSEEALSILRAKGYGTHGMDVAATARQVPEAKRG